MRAVLVLLVILLVVICCNALAPSVKPSATPTSSPKALISSQKSLKNTSNGAQSILYSLPPLRRNGTLTLDSVHSLYFEEYGKVPQNDTTLKDSSAHAANRKRIALSLHGGPGAGSFPRHAQFFDPEKYQRIILFDQRGCGRSKPRGETKFNTLNHLVEDIELLRTHLCIEKFDIILGGSWGSTLALAYAQNNPKRVGSIVLRGVCLFRPQEINWLFGDRKDGESNDKIKTSFISDKEELSTEWKTFQDAVNESDGNAKEVVNKERRRSVLHRYYSYLLGTDAISRVIAMKNWMAWEMKVSSFGVAKPKELGGILVWDSTIQKWNIERKNKTLVEQSLSQEDINAKFRRWPHRASFVQPKLSPSLHRVDSNFPRLKSNSNVTEADAKKFIPAQAMLTCFYSANDEYMMSKFNLLAKENLDKIRHIPCIAIQGGQDNICPPDSALDLHEEWPEMELRIVTEGKHSMYDTPITCELIKATDRLADI